MKRMFDTINHQLSESTNHIDVPLHTHSDGYKRENIESADNSIERLRLYIQLNSAATLETMLAVFQNGKHEYTYDTAIQLLGMYLEN